MRCLVRPLNCCQSADSSHVAWPQLPVVILKKGSDLVWVSDCELVEVEWMLAEEVLIQTEHVVVGQRALMLSVIRNERSTANAQEVPTASPIGPNPTPG